MDRVHRKDAPQKKRPARMLTQPLERVRYYFTPAALDGLIPALAWMPPAKARVEGVKSTIKTGSRPGSRVEYKRTNKRCRMVSPRSKNVRSERNVRRQRNSKIIDLMKLRIRPRKNCCM